MAKWVQQARLQIAVRKKTFSIQSCLQIIYFKKVLIQVQSVFNLPENTMITLRFRYFALTHLSKFRFLLMVVLSICASISLSLIWFNSMLALSLIYIYIVLGFNPMLVRYELYYSA